jgi:hypothetical protein
VFNLDVESLAVNVGPGHADACPEAFALLVTDLIRNVA